MTTTKNFVIRNKNEVGEWETLYPQTTAGQIITDDSKLFVTRAQIDGWDAKASTALATASTAGLMSPEDKTAIDALSGNLDGVKAELQAFTTTEIANLVGSAPETLNTLQELAAAIQAHETEYDALLEVVGSKAAKVYVDEQLALKADKTQVAQDIATAVASVTVTTVGATAPETSKPGDFWYEITE